MFGFFIALFGGLFWGGKFSSENLPLKKQTKTTSIEWIPTFLAKTILRERF